MFTTRGSVDFMALMGSDEQPWADTSEGRRGRLTTHAKEEGPTNFHDMG
ncbi:uncharacterized protein PgNI_03702 [Pyricularia grisea]|uniref:Uncharacterized protein n=1 Tax=Pyricularia grisea TaxID=148305 RepID=A0A6P8BB45_PYRGI|nr:uncharacterized protein PgNI_03702 [Pyricularia grisea]TLD12917.1 hypothetical protein PgNI_03702 [Pyricularia grisea]